MSLRAIRQEKGFTIQGLAEKSGVHYVKISQIEAGKINVENISFKNALRLSEALGCSPKDLLAE